jgi:2-methylcitrate dehydratase PrpD
MSEKDEIAHRLAAIVEDLQYDEIPPEVVSKAELFLLNGLGCMIGGRATQIGREIDFDRSLTAKEKHWIDAIEPTAEQYKIYRDASGAFSTELTTVFLRGINHPDSVIVPVLLNIGHEESREAVIEALVAGTEVMAKIGILLNPSLYFRGWHSTGVCGIFGAAAVACKLLKRTKEETVLAFQLAAGLANSDYYKLDKTNPVIKVINPGIAAVAGLSAAQQHCDLKIRENVDNFVNTFNGNSQSIDWDGYDILDLFYKSMPVVCAFHAILEPLNDLIVRHKIDSADISKIKVNYHKIPTDYYSGHVVNSIYGAQTSLPYSIAILAKRHHASLDVFTEDILGDQDIQRIANSVEVIPSHLDGTRDLIAGEIELTLESGERYTSKEDRAVGCLPKDIPNKFFLLAKFGGLSEKSASDIRSKIMNKEYSLKDLKM